MLRYLTGFDSDFLSQFERMRREMDQLFGGWDSPRGIRSVALGSYPPINIGVSPEQVDVYVFAAGLDPRELNISLQQNLLTIEGQRKLDTPKDGQFYRQERFSGGFRRVLTLPEDVDQDKVDASYRDGVLQITVQRREAIRPRQVEIK